MQDKVATGISIPKNLKDKIDLDRGDISRSKYILRILEKVYGKKEDNVPNESRGQPQTHSASSSTSKSQGDLQVGRYH